MATSPICSIPGCGKHVKCRGWCTMHYARFLAHGDPSLGAFVPRPKCSIDGCEKPNYGHGLCVAHYKRNARHGSPTAGSTGWGAVRMFLDAAVGHVGDDCLIFPFKRNRQGYARIHVDGVYLTAHAYVAERAHGPKPAPNYECCHSCGKGSSGCVNPHHLYWGTRQQNVQDAIAHGTAYKLKHGWGEKSAAAKFSDSTIEAARAALRSGETQKQVCAKFGISQAHVSRIASGKR